MRPLSSSVVSPPKVPGSAFLRMRQIKSWSNSLASQVIFIVSRFVCHKRVPLFVEVEIFWRPSFSFVTKNRLRRGDRDSNSMLDQPSKLQRNPAFVLLVKCLTLRGIFLGTKGLTYRSAPTPIVCVLALRGIVALLGVALRRVTLLGRIALGRIRLLPISHLRVLLVISAVVSCWWSLAIGTLLGRVVGSLGGLRIALRPVSGRFVLFARHCGFLSRIESCSKG